MRELRRRLREEPSALGEAVALASGHVRVSDVSPTVGVAAQPVAFVDPRSVDWYNGGVARPAAGGGGGAAGAAAGLPMSFQQSYLRSVFWDAVSKRFMFGTTRQGENRFVELTTGKPRLQTPAGRIIEMQASSFPRLLAAFANAKACNDAKIIGRVVRAGQRGQLYTMMMSKHVT